MFIDIHILLITELDLKKTPRDAVQVAHQKYFNSI